jgi:hypothetical protein
LKDQPPPAPAPTPEPPPLIIETEEQRWYREANAAIAQRAAADAERRAEERAANDVRAANWWAAIDARIEAKMVEHCRAFDELAKASAAFADAVSARLQELETLLTKLDATHAKMRAHDAREPIDLPGNPLVYKVKEQRRVN